MTNKPPHSSPNYRPHSSAFALNSRPRKPRLSESSRRETSKSDVLVMGNWKCEKSPRESHDFLKEWQRFRVVGSEVTLFPTALCLAKLQQSVDAARINLQLGAQNLSAYGRGAHTGEIAADMLTDIGIRNVLIGHSERRSEQGESGSLLAAKMQRAFESGIRPVFCFGETLADRQSGRTNEVLAEQLRSALSEVNSSEFVVAYEPVWAIGTGLIPENKQLVETAAAIREILRTLGFGNRLPLLYGGSVKRSNAANIMGLGCFNGLLIGGASLDAQHLFDIVKQCQSAGSLKQ